MQKRIRETEVAAHLPLVNVVRPRGRDVALVRAIVARRVDLLHLLVLSPDRADVESATTTRIQASAPRGQTVPFLMMSKFVRSLALRASRKARAAEVIVPLLRLRLKTTSNRKLRRVVVARRLACHMSAVFWVAILSGIGLVTRLHVTCRASLARLLASALDSSHLAFRTHLPHLVRECSLLVQRGLCV